MAKYNKKRARELKHDRFRDATMLLADKLADRVAGRRQQILYGLIALVVIAIAVYTFVHWRHKHADEAEAAMGRLLQSMPRTSPNAAAGLEGPVFTTNRSVPSAHPRV